MTKVRENNKPKDFNEKSPQELLDIIAKQGLLKNSYSGGQLNPEIKEAGLIKRQNGTYDVITPEGTRYFFMGFSHFLNAIKHSEKDLNLTLFQ